MVVVEAEVVVAGVEEEVEAEEDDMVEVIMEATEVMDVHTDIVVHGGGHMIITIQFTQLMMLFLMQAQNGVGQRSLNQKLDYQCLHLVMIGYVGQKSKE